MNKKLRLVGIIGFMIVTIGNLVDGTLLVILYPRIFWTFVRVMFTFDVVGVLLMLTSVILAKSEGVG